DSSTCEIAARLSPRRVAGYLAKYVTKSLHDFGVVANRLTAEAIDGLEISEHVRAILATVALLDGRAHRGITSLTGIGRWLHTLGYRGHITTKSRRYSTTMTALRVHRAQWTREKHMRLTDSKPVPDGEAQDGVDDPTGIAGDALWEFDRAGHANLGDRALIVSAALRRIESRRVGLAEYRDQSAQHEQGVVS
ncbi:MAG: plasmid replication initiator protein, partial [Mycobacteriaceae bacterium]|nr:plasmid replication initiator protein [Mycobacteriaceae bacterium]